METHLFSTSDADLNNCASLLAADELIAFPTETVYGLGANALSSNAVQKIYRAKGRPAHNPLIVHLADIAQVEKFGVMNAKARKLAQLFWPGPLTLVLPLNKQSKLAPQVTAGLESVAIRLPAHPVARKLLHITGFPLAAPSANISGHVSATDSDHVEDDLEGKIAGIIEDGASTLGLESTIISTLNKDKLHLLRAGSIPACKIEQKLSTPLFRATSNTASVTNTSTYQRNIIAPGQLTSHYAPNARLKLNCMTNDEGELMLGFGPKCPEAPGLNLSPTGNLQEAAANLFAYLRILDETGVRHINVMPIPNNNDLGEAINDRLKRAAAPRPNQENPAIDS